MSQHHGAQIDRRIGSVSGSGVPVAAAMVALLESTEARRRGTTEQVARISIARALRIPAATLRHLRTQRRKSVDSSVMGAIATRLAMVLEAEISELEHQLQIARHLGEDMREDLYAETAAAIAHARSLLERAARPG